MTSAPINMTGSRNIAGLPTNNERQSKMVSWEVLFFKDKKRKKNQRQHENTVQSTLVSHKCYVTKSPVTGKNLQSRNSTVLLIFFCYFYNLYILIL